MAIQQIPPINNYNQNPSYNNYRHTNPQQGYPPRAVYQQQYAQPNPQIQQQKPQSQIPPRNNKLLMRIIFVSFIIIIIASVLFMVKYQFSRLSSASSLENEDSQDQNQDAILQTQPKESENLLDKTFNQDYCLSLLRNHLSFPELSFTEKGYLPNTKKAFINGKKESNVVLIFEDSPTGQVLKSCMLSHNSQTKTDFSKASKYQCNEGISLLSSESQAKDYNSISLRINVADKVNDIIAYSSPRYAKYPEMKQSLITTLKCTEAQK